MKRSIKVLIAVLGIFSSILLSVYPKYEAFAMEDPEPPVNQEVTSDDNIVQKILNFGLSYWGAVAKESQQAYPLQQYSSSVVNGMKETIADLMNGGGIYVDSNGDYVFTDEASQTLYDSMMSNSDIDAKVISDFSNFSYLTDGYVNGQYLLDVNKCVAQLRANTPTENYMLVANRWTSDNGYIYTGLVAIDLTDVAYISIVRNGNGNGCFVFKNSGASDISKNGYMTGVQYNGSSYYNGGVRSLSGLGGIYGIWTYSDKAQIQFDWSDANANSQYLSFPVMENCWIRPSSAKFNQTISIYCTNSLIFSKDVASGNALNMQTNGIFANYNNIGNVSKKIIEENNWNTIYTNYVTNVNNEYTQDTGMTASEFRKIQKKYTASIIDAVQQGIENVEAAVKTTNQYLQAISVDVRNISDQISNLAGGGSGGGSGGLTQEQYESIMTKLVGIENYASAVAGNTDDIYLEAQDIADNTLDTNTKLVAIQTLLNNINSKIKNRNHDNPLPDDNFWMLLDDTLDDYTDTLMDGLLFKLQMIGTVLQGVVPFGYVAVIGVILNAMAVQPEEPVFEINLNSGDTAIPINYSGTIDLTWVAELMPMVRAFQVLLFIIGLIWASFEIFTTLGSLFS